jgi:hypothetical protein
MTRLNGDVAPGIPPKPRYFNLADVLLDGAAFIGSSVCSVGAGKPLPSQLSNTMMCCQCGEMFDSYDPGGSYIPPQARL